MEETLVIGGGTSGLFTAALLAKEGYQVKVYEKERELGGRAKTWVKDGFTVDYGLHLVRNGEKGFITTTLADLGEKLELISLKELEILCYKDKKFHPLPHDATEFATTEMITDNDKNIVFSTLSKKGITKESMDRSVLSWIEEVGGSEKLKEFAVFLSLGIVCPFIERASLGEVFDLMRRRIALGNPKTGYPPGGFGVIHKKLTKIIRDYGGDVYTQKEAREIRVENGKVKGVKFAEGFVEAKIVICAFPPQMLFNILDENLVEPKRRELLKNLRPTAGVSIDYGLKAKITEIDNLIISSEDLFLLGMVTSNIDPSVAPPDKQLMTFVAITNREDILDKEKAKVILSRLEEKIKEMFPHLSDNLEWRRPLFLPFINGVELNFNQYRERRPQPDTPGIEGLFLSGDTLAAESAGGELAVTSALACVDKLCSG